MRSPTPTGEPTVSELNEKYSDEVEKLLEMGKEKEYLTFDDINRLLPPELNSADDIEAIFDVIGAEGISISENDEKFMEVAAIADHNGDGKIDNVIEEEIDLDLTTASLDKTNDPVRLYLREMAVVPLLTRDGEVAIARRIERGRMRIHKAIARAPICIEQMVENLERQNKEKARAHLRDLRPNHGGIEAPEEHAQGQETGQQDNAPEHLHGAAAKRPWGWTV